MSDRKEQTSAFEPLLLPSLLKERNELTDLALSVATKSTAFKASLPAAIQSSLASTVRAMNCYYSNLIEGHNTHPIAIEQALNNNYDSDPIKRDLQLEAKAHITVQAWLDAGGLTESPFSINAIQKIHKKFCENLPEDLLWIQDPKTKEKITIIPGAFRDRDVEVGQLVAISSGAIPRFLEKYQNTYSDLSKTETLLALAASHHRFLWIHPFLDGNGRVARFISYITLHDLLDTGGLWSIARGLARNSQTYKNHLAECDLKRRNDLDGRGNLSQEALVSFTRFFLTTCIDQIDFMQQLMQPDKLRNRILVWTKEEIEANHLPPQSLLIIERILYVGEIYRHEIPDILGVTDRHARRITAKLIENNVLISDSDKSPIRLHFSVKEANRWLPGLFPEI